MLRNTRAKSECKLNLCNGKEIKLKKNQNFYQHAIYAIMFRYNDNTKKRNLYLQSKEKKQISKEKGKNQKNASSKYQLQVAQIQASEAAVVNNIAKNICKYANTRYIRT